jgi:hypothetical protein
MDEHPAPEHCPKCHAGSPRVLEGMAFAWVDYYRCNNCGFVWTIPKEDVTVPPIPQKQRSR